MPMLRLVYAPLRRMKPEQARLYLLCFVWLRYRQFTDTWSPP